MSGLRFLLNSIVILAVACILHFGVPAALAQPQYTVKDLGPFRVHTMNDLGQAAGDIGVLRKPVLYSDGQLKDITPPGGQNGEAWGINNAGHVTGRVGLCNMVNGNCQGFSRAFIYRNGQFEILGTLGGRDSWGWAINDAGQVSGESDSGGPSSNRHAVIFHNGTLQDINTIIGTTSSFARSINRTAQIIGHASSTSNFGAFLFSNGNTVFFDPNGSPNDINDIGHVVGGCCWNDDGKRRAILFSNGVRTDLGSLTPTRMYNDAIGINNQGQIVGTSATSGFPFASDDERAFIYSNGVMQDLNSLIPAGSGWLLNAAVDINSAGQIVGNGKLNGEDRAFLLTPTEPVILTDEINQVIALESVSFLRGPFRSSTSRNLSSDQRTRVTLITRNIDLIPGEAIAPPSVSAEDEVHRIFALPVEYVGGIPGAASLVQIVVRLPEDITPGNLQLRVSFRGRTSRTAGLIVTNAPPF
jgi:probable HAF family extracellular repeat protein